MIHAKPMCLILAVLLSCAIAIPFAAGDDFAPVTFKKNGGFNWFLDNRALVDGDKLLFGSVAGTTRDGSTAGDVQITTYDLTKNTSSTATLAPAFAADDHVAPVLLKRPDGRYLAAFQKHDADGLMRWVVSAQPGDASAWGTIQTVSGNTVDDRGICFSNLIALPATNGVRIYNFVRGAGSDPNYLISNDHGDTFQYGGRLMTWDNPHPPYPGRPYVKYASNGIDTIWLAATEDHPGEYDTGIYAGFIRNSRVFPSSGRSLGPLSTTAETAIKPTGLTRVFSGMPDAVAFVNDLKVAPDGRPVITFSVRKDDGHDLRYWFARFDGRAWQSHEIARAGSAISTEEANAAGLAAIDPANPWVVFIAANSDPKTGEPLKSSADGKRHFEIFKGTTSDQGATWSWQPLTTNSSVDNIRPIVPARDSNRRILLWLRGTMTTYKDYNLDIVGIVEPDAGPSMQLPLHMQASITASPKQDGFRVNANAARDGLEPRSSRDNTPLSHFDWWPDKNVNEWVQYDWSKPVTISSTGVYWWDDTGSGECRCPTSWRALYKEGDEWKPVETTDTPGVERDKYNTIKFKTVTTTALRLEIVLSPSPENQRLSCGIQEWKVE